MPQELYSGEWLITRVLPSGVFLGVRSSKLNHIAYYIHIKYYRNLGHPKQKRSSLRHRKEGETFEGIYTEKRSEDPFFSSKNNFGWLASKCGRSFIYLNKNLPWLPSWLLSPPHGCLKGSFFNDLLAGICPGWCDTPMRGQGDGTLSWWKTPSSIEPCSEVPTFGWWRTGIWVNGSKPG